MSLQNFSLQAMEESAIRQAEADVEIIDVGVTSKAQNLFDALSKTIHPPPSFGSSPNLKALALEVNKPQGHDEDNSVHVNSQYSRYMHEINKAKRPPSLKKACRRPNRPCCIWDHSESYI